MENKTYSLTELAQASRMTTRNIRYYINNEILPPPRTMGKKAYYDDDHLVRLVAARRLQREKRYSLSQIRQIFSGLEAQPDGLDLTRVENLIHSSLGLEYFLNQAPAPLDELATPSEQESSGLEAAASSELFESREDSQQSFPAQMASKRGGLSRETQVPNLGYVMDAETAAKIKPSDYWNAKLITNTAFDGVTPGASEAQIYAQKLLAQSQSPKTWVDPSNPTISIGQPLAPARFAGLVGGLDVSSKQTSVPGGLLPFDLNDPENVTNQLLRQASEPGYAYNPASNYTPGLGTRSQWERIFLSSDLELSVRRPTTRPTNKALARIVEAARLILEEENS
jgi:DNA-binding transcriptional MerR regulator